jgi:ribosome small subunit-dependent GTPase A
MSDRSQRWLEHFLNRDTERKLRKQARRDRAPKQVRRKDWQPDTFLNEEQLDVADDPQVERVMPLGTHERQRATLAAVLAGQQIPDADEDEVASGDLDTGTVTRTGPNVCCVQVSEGPLICSIRACGPAGTLPVVGDRVMVRQTGRGAAVLAHILPRQTQLTRADVALNHQQQVVVANADQVLIVASWLQPTIWFELVDRYLIAAERGGLRPIICINKVDLAEATECQAALRPYLALGYAVVFTSAVTGLGLEELRRVLRGQATVLAGLSGVGKSSLLRALLPNLSLPVSAVSRHSGEGRHTTTQAQLIALPGGGVVVDTPGIREFGLAGVRRADLASYYREFAAFASACRFADCTHSGEPDCAVASASGNDGISAQRYSNYLKILGTLPE